MSMTSDEYVEHKGVRCPNCGSDRVDCDQPSSEVECYRLRKGIVLMLRTCDKDMRSRGKFQWPMSGEVVAPDWDLEPRCGGGLHGLPWGEGDASLLDWSDDAKGVVWEADATGLVDIDGQKSKAQRGNVVFVGTLHEAAMWINDVAPGHIIPALTQTAGRNSTQTAGYRSTQKAGEGSVMIQWWWNGKTCEKRIGEVREGALTSNVWYRLNNTGEWYEVPDSEVKEV